MAYTSLRRSVALLAGLVLLVACSPGGTEDRQTTSGSGTFPVTLTDDEGVSVTLDRPPRRVVTFAPSNTEIVFALGAKDTLVGVSGEYDNFPREARTIERVGGAGEFGVDPNIEKVVSLRPDLMLTIAGGEQWKKQLRDLGIKVFTVNATSYDDLVADIEKIASLLGRQQEAKELISYLRNVAAETQSKVSQEPPVPCFFEVYYPPLTTVGPNTFIFDILELAGCAPVSADAKSDYAEWSVEQLVRDGPDVYLVSSESGVSPKAVAKRPGFRAIPAVRDGKVRLVNSDIIARPGPRVVEGLTFVANLLHPSLVG